MARKGKNKKAQKQKQKKKQNYNKKEFCEVLCQTCLICEKPSASLCYGYLFKHEPRSFVNKVFNNLVDLHEYYQCMNRSMRSISIEQFQNVVCRTGICFNGDSYASATCDRTEECYRDFHKQMGSDGTSAVIHDLSGGVITFKNNKSNKSTLSYGKKHKKRKKKHRYVCKSYPTFFCRNNDEFKGMVRKILYGDNDNEQNSNQELPAVAAGEAGEHTKGGEPKV